LATIKSLLVVWKDAISGLYYHIGTLNYNGNFYTFSYTYHGDSPRNVNEAIKKGYKLHPAFPILNGAYQSENLFPAFNRRIPDESRIGYESILAEFNLDKNADRMDLLRETRGALAGDPYSFEEPLRLKGNTLNTNFYINGMRHREHLSKSWYDEISVGDSLFAELEEENKYDPYASKILTRDGIHLGYIPGIYAQAVHSLLKQNIPINLHIKKIRPKFAPQWWVRVELNAKVELNHADKRYRKNLEGLIFQENA
jgi:hypothetical protein